MRTRSLALLAAAAMVGSIFLPWTVTPLGNGPAPFEVLRQIDPGQLPRMLAEGPPEMLTLAASLALGALFVALAVVGLEGRWLAMLAGAMPPLTAGIVLWRAREASAPDAQVADLLRQMTENFGHGVWAWLGGGALLLLLGLVDPGRRA